MFEHERAAVLHPVGFIGRRYRGVQWEVGVRWQRYAVAGAAPALRRAVG